MNTTLYTRALKSNVERAVSCSLDLFSYFLGARASRNEHGADTRHKLLGKVKAVLEEIGDDDGLSACRARREKGDETNGARTTGK